MLLKEAPFFIVGFVAVKSMREIEIIVGAAKLRES